MGNTALSAFGWGKQSGKGSKASQPGFYQGVTGGIMVDLPIDQKPVEETTGLGAGQGEYRESVIPGADVPMFMRPKAIGSLLRAILGSVSTTGTGPYTHTITMGSTIPYYTLFGTLDSELRDVTDAKLDQLVIEWEGNGPVKVTPTWAGCTPSYGSARTATVDERTDDMFLGSGVTVQYDIDGSTLATVKTISGKITIKRNVSPLMVAGQVTPEDVNEGSLTVDVEMKVRVSSLTDQRTIITGTSNGTTVSGSPVYGSVSAAFALGTNSVTIAGTRVPWQATTPEADPNGGPFETTLSGSLYIASGGSTPVTATVINGQASY